MLAAVDEDMTDLETGWADMQGLSTEVSPSPSVRV